MIRILSILLALTVALSACAPSSTSGGKAGGSYRISRSDAGTIQFRMLDPLARYVGAKPSMALRL